MSGRQAAVVIGLMLLQALVLHLLGRVWICECGTVRLWVGDMLGARRMVLTDAAVSIDDGALVLRQRGNATFGLAVWPRLPAMPGIRAERGTGVLQRYRATVPARSLPQPELRQIRKPGNVPPPNLSGPRGTVAQPAPEAHAAAGAWRFTPGKDVLAVEQALERIVPQEYRLHAHHWLILHGRYTCVARKPLCPTCVVRDLCRFKDKTKELPAVKPKLAVKKRGP